MDHYYLHGTHETTGAGSSVNIPYGVTLDGAPALHDVECLTPGVSIDSVVPGATGLAVQFSPAQPAGTFFEWMVTTAASVKALFRSSMLEFSGLDQAGAVQGSDESLLVRDGAPKRYSFATYAANLVTGVLETGIANIPEGAESVEVEFGNVFASAPSVALSPAALGDPPELIVGTVTSISGQGFTFELAAPAPAGASLLWTAVAPNLPQAASVAGDTLWTENPDGSISPA